MKSNRNVQFLKTEQSFMIFAKIQPSFTDMFKERDPRPKLSALDPELRARIDDTYVAVSERMAPFFPSQSCFAAAEALRDLGLQFKDGNFKTDKDGWWKHWWAEDDFGRKVELTGQQFNWLMNEPSIPAGALVIDKDNPLYRRYRTGLIPEVLYYEVMNRIDLEITLFFDERRFRRESKIRKK